MSAYLATDTLVLPFTSAADLSNKKGYFVKAGASQGLVAPITGATDASVGVVVVGEAIGGNNAVALPGVNGTVKVMVGANPGTIAQFTKLQLAADGSVIADAGSGARRIVAEALEPGEAGEWIKARLLEPVVYSGS